MKKITFRTVIATFLLGAVGYLGNTGAQWAIAKYHAGLAAQDERRKAMGDSTRLDMKYMAEYITDAKMDTGKITPERLKEFLNSH